MANIKAKGITARIDVDTIDARASISQLKRSIRQLNTRFKDTYRSQLMAGHAEDALKTKNRGARAQYEALGDAIDKVRKALQKANEAGETGTHNYHHAELDLQNMVEWRKRENYVMTHTNHLLILHNDALRDSIETMRHNQQVGRDLLAQYKAEGDQVKVNNQIMENRKQKMQDLKNVTRQYADTEDRAKKAGIDNTGFKDYDKIVEGAHRAKESQAQLRHEIAMDTSDLQALNREANNDREISQTKIRTYNDESRSVAANAERVNDLNKKLSQLHSIQSETQSDINKERNAGFGNSDQVENLTKKLYRLKEAEASAKSELGGLQSHLTDGRKYDQLYNQSTNSVVESLKSLKANAEAGRKEYQLLGNNIQHEAHMYDLQRQHVERVAEANRNNNDQTGRASLAYQRENAKLQAMNATLARHKHRIDTLGKSYGSMQLRSVRAYDNMSNHITKLDHSAHGYLRTAHAMTNGSIALGAAFIYGVKQAAGLENEFNKVKNLLNASGESMRQAGSEVKEMNQNATDMSMKYGENQKNIANGFESLVRRGYTGKQALASQKYYLQGTIASGDKYGDVMHTAASTLEAFNMRSNNTNKMVGNTKKVINQLAYSADLTATDMKGIGYGMQYVGGSAHNAHQSLSETASALGELSNRGENSTVAATGLRKILLSLATIKTSKNGKALKQLGLQPKDLMDASGNLKSLQDIFTLFRSKMQGMSSTQQASVFKSLFGTTGYNSAVDLMNSTDGLKKLNAQVAKSQDQAHGAGYAQQIAQKNMNSTEMQFKRLTAAGQELAKDYAEGLNPAFKRFSVVAVAAARGIDDLPKPLKNLLTLGTALVPIFGAITYGMATVKKGLAVWNGIERWHLRYFTASEDALKASDNVYSAHISRLRQTADAQNQVNAATQRGTQLTNQNNASVEKGTAAGYTTDQSSGLILPNDDTPSKGSSGKMQYAKNVAGRIPWKSALTMGALTGGTEMASGDTRGGAYDAVGTTGGMLAGGALGALAGPIGSKIGSVAGMITGPMITKGIANTLNHPYHVGKNMPVQTGEDRGITRRLDNDLKHIDGSTQSYVRHEAGLNTKAATQFTANGGRITKSLRQTAANMYNTARQYGTKELQNEDNTLETARKKGQINSQQAIEGETRLQTSESSVTAKISQYDSKAMNNAHLTASQREKYFSKADSYEMRLTSLSGKNNTKLLSDLNKRTSKLNTKSYASVLSQANSNFKATKKSASAHYKNQIASAKNAYSTLEKAGVVHGKSASKSISSIENLDSSQRASAVNKAKATSRSVTDTASRMADDTTKKHYKASKSASAANSSMASDDSRIASDNAKAWHHFSTNLTNGLESTFQAIIYDFRHPLHPTKNKKAINQNLSHMHANGTFDTQQVAVNDPMTQAFNSHANGSYDTAALHFATGVLPGIGRNENAVINDGGGRELVKLPNGQFVLPSGRNVHTVLPKGTSVFNAMQTRKMLSMITPAIHHAAGTVGEASFAGGTGRGRKSTVKVKTPEGGLTNTAKKTKKSMKNIHDILEHGYKKSNKDASKQLDKFHDHNNDSWDDTQDITKKHAKDIHDDTVSRYGKMRDEINDSMQKSNTWTNNRLNTTVGYFRHHFAMLPPITRNSMKAGINNINGGIRGIDSALAKFGGNQHVLSMVHYAGGTSGPSMQRQLAVLNDATGGPSQEAVVSDSGKVRMPKGRNVVTALNPGDKVLNGSDTLRAIRSGLIPHYAGGLKSDDALRKLASHYVKKPTSFTNDTFNKFATIIGDTLTRGLTRTPKAGIQSSANNWSSAMWHYIDSLINGGPSSGLLGEAEKLGHRAKGYSENTTKRMGPNYYDCASLVWTALKDLGVHVSGGTTVQPIMNAFAGHRVSRSDAKPGDLVGSKDHIGLVADNGAHHYYSAQDPKDGIGMEPLVESAFPDGWFHIERVDKLADHNDHYKSPLTGLVKRQLGAKSSKWIQAHLGDGGELGNPKGLGVNKWIPAIKRAADVMHASLTPRLESLLLGTMANESHGDAGITGINDGDGTGPALGLLQYKRGSFDSYAVKGHNDIFKGYDQLLAFFNSDNYKNALVGYDTANGKNGGEWSPLHGSGPSGSRRYAHGGLSVADKMAHISEGNKPEMVLPLTNRSRAVELMLKSLQYMFGNNNQNNNRQNNQQQSQINSGQALQDRRFEQELIQSNRNKDKLIDKILNKMTVLIQTVQNKPVISDADIYRGNRRITMNKARLRNFNRGTF